MQDEQHQQQQQQKFSDTNLMTNQQENPSVVSVQPQRSANLKNDKIESTWPSDLLVKKNATVPFLPSPICFKFMQDEQQQQQKFNGTNLTTNQQENSSIVSIQPQGSPDLKNDKIESTVSSQKNNVMVIKRDQESYHHDAGVTSEDDEDKVHVSGHGSARNEGESEDINGRERLKRHRVEVAGHVWIPDIWGQEELLKDWIDCSAFDKSLMNSNIMSAREALVHETRTPNSTCRLRIENSC